MHFRNAMLYDVGGFNQAILFSRWLFVNVYGLAFAARVMLKISCQKRVTAAGADTCCCNVISGLRTICTDNALQLLYLVSRTVAGLQACCLRHLLNHLEGFDSIFVQFLAKLDVNSLLQLASVAAAT